MERARCMTQANKAPHFLLTEVVNIANYFVNGSATRVKAWLGYPKGSCHFIFIGPPHIKNMFLKLNDTFILKV